MLPHLNAHAEKAAQLITPKGRSKDHSAIFLLPGKSLLFKWKKVTKFKAENPGAPQSRKIEQISQSRSESVMWRSFGRDPWGGDWPSWVVNMLLTLRKFVQPVDQRLNSSLNYDKANASSTVN